MALMKIYISLISLFLFPGIAHADVTVYVQSLQAKIMQQPDFSASVIGTAKRGDTLSVTARKGAWYQIQFAEKIGYIAALLVADHPPRNGKRAINADANIGNNARRRASAVATAGATRGLTSDDRKRASQNGVADYSALNFMDKAAVSEIQAEDFLKKGLGE